MESYEEKQLIEEKKNQIKDQYHPRNSSDSHRHTYARGFKNCYDGNQFGHNSSYIPHLKGLNLL